MLLCTVSQSLDVPENANSVISQPSGHWESRSREGMDCNVAQDIFVCVGVVDNDLHHSDVSMAIPGPKLKAYTLNMCDLLHVN